MAATSDFGATRHVGANRPARPAAMSAPSMMPISITEVTSVRTLARNAAAFVAGCQYGHEDACTPTAATIFDPHNANADVTPHGRPESVSVAIFTAARPSAPAANGHGPRSHALSVP